MDVTRRPGTRPAWVLGLSGFLGAFVQSCRLLQKLGTAQAVVTAAAFVWVPEDNHSLCALAGDTLRETQAPQKRQPGLGGGCSTPTPIDMGRGQLRFGIPGRVPGGSLEGASLSALGVQTRVLSPLEKDSSPRRTPSSRMWNL